MLVSTDHEPMSMLKALSARNAGAGNTHTTGTSASASASIGAKQENESTSRTKTNTINKRDQEIDPASRRSTFRNNLPKHHSDRNFQSLKFSQTSKSCEPKTVTVTSNRDIFPTRSIVSRALEVMSNSLKDGDCVAQKEDNFKECSVTGTESGGAESDSGKEEASMDDSDSDNNNNTNNDESIKAPGTLTAQRSFRKIAKKRRKAGGQSSFHHSKSSKEYLRKAQEAYQKLKISEQENEKNNQLVLESSSGSDRSSKDDINPCGYEDLDASTKPEKEPDQVDYGYGDPAEKKPQEAVDYGYGDPAESQPQGTVDYGYGDSNATQPQQPRRGGRARRRNSVTKFSVQAANIVAAKTATERILQLKPSLTSLLRGRSSTPTKHRRELNYELKRSSAKQNTEQRQEEGRRHEDQKNNVRPVPPQRSSSNACNVFGNRDATKHSSESQERMKSKQSQQEESSTSLQPVSAAFNPHLKLTSDYFSSDPKPSLFRENSGRSNKISMRFKAPTRTDSWLSYDNSYSNNDDDDADSLAPDMESLCSIRDSSPRLDNNHSFRNTDLPPVPPTPQASPLTQASVSTSRLTSPDNRTGLTAGRSTSGEISGRKSLVVSWSNGSNKDASLSRFAAEKSRSTSGERLSGSGNKFPICPYPRNVTIPKSAVASKSCMPAPVNRTPSYTGSQQ